MKALSIKNLNWINDNQGSKLIAFSTVWEVSELVYIEYADLYDLFRVRFGYYEGQPVMQVSGKTSFTFIVPVEWVESKAVPFFSVTKAGAKKAGISTGEVEEFPETVSVPTPATLDSAAYDAEKNKADLQAEERRLYGGLTFDEYQNEL